MDTQKKLNLKKILQISSVSEFYEWLPKNAIDKLAFVSLAIFSLSPLIVAFFTLFTPIFDEMIVINRNLLDNIMFPFIAIMTVTVMVIKIGQLHFEKRLKLKSILHHPTLVFVGLLVLWMIIDVLFITGINPYVIVGKGLVHEPFLLIIEYFLGFFALGLVIREPIIKVWLLRFMLLISVLLIPFAFYFWKVLQASPVYYDWSPSVACVFSNPNYYGYFLTVFVSLSVAMFAGAKQHKWRILYGIALVLNTVVLSYNNTLGAWVGCICACVFMIVVFGIKNRRIDKWLWIASLLFIMSFIITGICNGLLIRNFSGLFGDIGSLVNNANSKAAQHAGSGRWSIWKKCIELLKQHPVFGVGFEGIKALNLDQFVGNERPHNEFLQYALFYGIPAGVLYIASCVSLFIRDIKNRIKLGNETLAALVASFGYLAGSFFGLTVYNTAPYLFIMMGLAYYHNETKTGQSTLPC